jgi:hypothetical protein
VVNTARYAEPLDIPEPLLQPGVVMHNSRLCNDLMTTNDHPLMTELAREAEVTRMLRMAGIEVTFVD